MRGLDPRIHLKKQSQFSKMDCIGTRACPSSAVSSAASRVNPTCGVKPGNDAWMDCRQRPLVLGQIDQTPEELLCGALKIASNRSCRSANMNTAKALNGVSISEILDAVNKLCASEYFANAPQLQHFLKYVITQTLEGKADRLKAYSIGVEALGRSSEFDPDKDSIVRVEAVRLRRALQAYYDFDGKSDAVQICLPTGHYVPVFDIRASSVCTNLASQLRNIAPIALSSAALFIAIISFVTCYVAIYNNP
jgi:hypothetical protein